MSAISCTKCIFAIQDGDDFTCRAGRIDKFLELGKAERADDGSYQLKQFCNLYRPKAWLLTDEKIEEDAALVEMVSYSIERSIVRGSVGSTWETAKDVCYCYRWNS